MSSAPKHQTKQKFKCTADRPELYHCLACFFKSFKVGWRQDMIVTSFHAFMKGGTRQPLLSWITMRLNVMMWLDQVNSLYREMFINRKVVFYYAALFICSVRSRWRTLKRSETQILLWATTSRKSDRIITTLGSLTWLCAAICVSLFLCNLPAVLFNISEAACQRLCHSNTKYVNNKAFRRWWPPHFHVIL